MNLAEVIAAFSRAISDAGIPLPVEVIADGVLRRFSTNGRHGDSAGWYRLHADGVPCGVFGDWRSGVSAKWTARADHRMTREERQAMSARIGLLEKERAAQDKEREAAARDRLERLWGQALPVTVAHPYAERKRMQNVHGARLIGDDLAIPCFDNRVLTAIQLISGDGRKRFVPGSKVRGYFSIGKMNGTIVISEGFSTAVAIHESTGHAVAVSFGHGGLLRVARTLRGKFPTATLIIAADDDIDVAGNPGKTSATEAAKAIGGLLAMPVFGRTRPEGMTDFSDLLLRSGPEAVRACIEIARKV